jgi:hypothetical protein
MESKGITLIRFTILLFKEFLNLLIYKLLERKLTGYIEY